MCICARNMRHALFFLLVALCAVAVACKPIDPIRLEPTIEDPPALASAIRFSDPGKTSQLLRGFYDLQGGVWRWTAPQFAVTLAPPAGAATRGARLVLEFSLPDSSIDLLKNVTVAAKISHVPLPPETFTTPGRHQYQSDVPASVLDKREVTIDFAVDKFVTPPKDGRDLALIVTAVALEPK
jgi:hypothetical protein